MSFQSHRMLHLATTAGHESTTTAPCDRPFDEPDQALLRAALETMCQDFHELLYTLNDSDLSRQRFAVAACSVGELLTLTIAELARMPVVVDGLRQDRNGERIPAWLLTLWQIICTRFGGQRATCASLHLEVDRAIDVALTLLASVQAAEWQLGAHRYAEGYCPLAWIFTRPIYHFADHVVAIRQILAQEARPAKVIVAQLF